MQPIVFIYTEQIIITIGMGVAKAIDEEPREIVSQAMSRLDKMK